MAIVDGGDLVVKALRGEGTKHIFALSGDYDMAIFDACIDEEMRIIDTRHEQAAVHMADGWARVTGEPGVAVVTAGPGLADAVPGIITAYQMGSPVVVISGRVPMRDFDTGFGMDYSQTQLLAPITKWAATCYDPKRIPEYVAMAFRYATSGRPGPVFLDIPQDVLEAKVEESEMSPLPWSHTRARPQGDPDLVRQAVEALHTAQRPLIVAGSGVAWAGASAQLRELAELIQAPVLLNQMGRGCLPEDHPLCFGPFRVGAREADVILVVGTRINFWLNKGQPPVFAPPEAGQRWIQIDIEAGEIGRNRPIDIGIAGDARRVLEQMVEAARGLKGWGRPEWVAEVQRQGQARRQRAEADAGSDKVPIHPLRLCHEIGGFLDREATLCIDGGDCAVFAAMGLRVYGPGRWLDQGNLGLIGSGIPFAIAAKLARPQEQVLVLNGDGTFGLNGMEMDTAIRHHLPIVVVVANDAAWGMIKHRQELIYGPDRVVGTELGLTRYDRVVEALGGYGEFVEQPQDIRPALERAFASGRPALINVVVDPTIASPATRRTARGRG
jgi:acetolactate synthase-1/2/3 large subunit